MTAAYQCPVCDYIYDKSQGWPEDGIEPGIRWDDIPEDWSCPWSRRTSIWHEEATHP
ncbi:rubredoxin [Mycobacterium lepromatosis]|uniref:rubredoxin n=1 Tax=Mycobacterium lepromatosis TaxID=480418 RepID=UPI0009E47106|nr:rubredoxin [Mycobacterium lepromatosis]